MPAIARPERSQPEVDHTTAALAPPQAGKERKHTPYSVYAWGGIAPLFKHRLVITFLLADRSHTSYMADQTHSATEYLKRKRVMPITEVQEY